jgi:hypothetical protein
MLTCTATNSAACYLWSGHSAGSSQPNLLPGFGLRAAGLRRGWDKGQRAPGDLMDEFLGLFVGSVPFLGRVRQAKPAGFLSQQIQ